MKDRLKEYTELKSKIEKLNKSKNKNIGVMETLTKQLKTEHGCSSIQEAEKKLTKLIKEEDELKTEFDNALLKLKEKWPDKW